MLKKICEKINTFTGWKVSAIVEYRDRDTYPVITFSEKGKELVYCFNGITSSVLSLSLSGTIPGREQLTELTGRCQHFGLSLIDEIEIKNYLKHLMYQRKKNKEALRREIDFRKKNNLQSLDLSFL